MTGNMSAMPVDRRVIATILLHSGPIFSGQRPQGEGQEGGREIAVMDNWEMRQNSLKEHLKKKNDKCLYTVFFFKQNVCGSKAFFISFFFQLNKSYYGLLCPVPGPNLG